MFTQMYEEKYMRFPEGRSKALTFSYDDGVKADIRLMAIFDKYGLKGTFNINNLCFGKEYESWHNRMDEQSTFEAFNACGHEIAMHGARHVFLEKIPLAEVVNEIAVNRVYLENKFKRIVRGLAYAYGSYNDEIVNILKATGVAYARTTVSSHSFEIPVDWLRLQPTCHHKDEKFGGLADKFICSSPEDTVKHREPWLFYIWGHSFEFEENGNWEIIENFAKRVSGKKDVWFATNGEIYDYVKAYNCLVFSMDGERAYNPSAIPVWIELRGKVYKIDGGKQISFQSAIDF